MGVQDCKSAVSESSEGVKKIFFKHGHVAYQIDGDDEQNRMQVTFSS